jgi:hypothetical protein
VVEPHINNTTTSVASQCVLVMVTVIDTSPQPA